MFKIQNRKTKEIAAITFETKKDAVFHLIYAHGLTWDRRWSVVTA